MKGTEVRLDIAEVDPILLADGEKLAQICAKAAEEAGATVVKVSWANLGNGRNPAWRHSGHSPERIPPHSSHLLRRGLGGP